MEKREILVAFRGLGADRTGQLALFPLMPSTVEEQQLGVEYMPHVRAGANEDMLGCFRVMTTAGASGIVPCAPKAHHSSSSQVARNKFRVPQLV